MAFHISLSDMSTFLSCRFRWDLSSPNRQSIRHKTTARLYLSTGTALHLAIEAGARGDDPVEAADTFMAEERDAKVQEYREENGFLPWVQEMAEFDEAAVFTHDLVAQYFETYGDNPLGKQGLKYLGTEVPFKIDISEKLGLEPGSVYYIGTIDAVAEDAESNLWIVENKSYSAAPLSDDLQFHFQSTGYAVAFEMLTGMPVTGGLYNGVSKNLIKEPKLLKSGKLSVAKDQRVTYDSYMKGIKRYGLNPDDYREFLDMLQKREREGDTRFFYQEKFFYNEEQKSTWWADFLAVAQEMIGDPKIYRTIPFNGCGPQGNGCWYTDICRSAHSGGDVQYILGKRYTQGSYGSYSETEGIEPVMISSVEDLRKLLKEHS